MTDLKSLDAISAYNNANNMVKSASAAINAAPAQNVTSDFLEMVGQSLGNVADSAHASEAQSIKALSNKVTLDDLATSITNAELSLRSVIAVRDKVIEAYKTISQMPI